MKNCFKSLTQICLTVFLWSLKVSHILVFGADVIFLLENEEVFEKCGGHHGNGIHDLFDMSKLNIEIDDYTMHVAGSITVVWDVQPTDRITCRIELQKKQRGSWQPTMYNMIKNDFCSTMFSPAEVWYDTLSSNITPKECLNVKGTVYQIEKIEKFISLKTPKPNDLIGTSKIVIRFEAYDEKGQMRPNDICVELNGEFEKLDG